MSDDDGSYGEFLAPLFARSSTGYWEDLASIFWAIVSDAAYEVLKRGVRKPELVQLLSDVIRDLTDEEHASTDYDRALAKQRRTLRVVKIDDGVSGVECFDFAATVTKLPSW